MAGQRLYPARGRERSRLAGDEWAVRMQDIWNLENPEEPVADDRIRDSVSLVRVAPDAQSGTPDRVLVVRRDEFERRD